MKDSTKRFSDRVADYIKYRPSYPGEVIDLLRTDCGLNDQSIVADIGSGTGILTRKFLESGYSVIGVEPNNEMRLAAEDLLAQHGRFRSVSASAENTALGENSIDLVVAGQAFHWFDPTHSKNELLRILKPGGWIALIWNERLEEATPFLREYKQLIQRHANDYGITNHKNVTEEVIGRFFSPSSYQIKSFPNHQDFDFEGLLGRCLSSSYMPGRGELACELLVTDLKNLFDLHEKNGSVRIEYATHVYLGQMNP